MRNKEDFQKNNHNNNIINDLNILIVILIS